MIEETGVHPISETLPYVCPCCDYVVDVEFMRFSRVPKPEQHCWQCGAEIPNDIKSNPLWREHDEED